MAARELTGSSAINKKTPTVSLESSSDQEDVNIFITPKKKGTKGNSTKIESSDSYPSQATVNESSDEELLPEVSALFTPKMSKGEPVMADVLALLSPPKKLKFDNVKSVAANIFDSTSQIASDINNERTSSVLHLNLKRTA